MKTCAWIVAGGGLAAAILLGSCAEPPPVGEYRPTSQGTLTATTRMRGEGAGAARELSGDREGVMRRNGVLYSVKDRGLTRLTGAQRITSNLYLEANGEITLGDGRRMPVSEGYMLTTTGELEEIPPYLR